MPRAPAPLLALLVACSSVACDDRCEVERHAIDVDEPGPFGASSRETFGFVEGPRVGMLWWTDTPRAVEITTTLDASADTVDFVHHGPGRLVCPDAFGTQAQVHIVTDDLLLDDTFDVWLEVWNEAPPEWVEVNHDVSTHEFDGFGIVPASAQRELGMTLRLTWRDDAGGSLVGSLVLGDDEIMRFDAVTQ